MRKSFIAALIVVTTICCMQAYGQLSNATVSGTIEDPSRAILPGVAITATNTATGVSTTAVSNESGVYNLPGLLPGPYKVSAELPGFQTKTYEITLGNAQTVRLNFALNVAGVGTNVDVSVAVDTLLATSSASVGEVLSESKLKDLPLVGNNALFLVNTLAGTRMDDNGVTGTFAGMTNYNVNVVRDGVDASASARYMQAGIQTATMLNPDLIGELRLIVAPVDVEMGRGNGQMIVQTKSGTNQFRGSAVWSVRNSALDSNYWSNNKQVDSKTGAWKAIPLDWNNRHQYTVSFGGPIIRNKTFFFGLWDGLINNRRTVQNVQVLTPCAANGIFRYFDNWNNGNAIQTISLGATPAIAVVNSIGNPLPPATNPDGSPANGTLRYTSVFGQLPANLPAANADCSNIAALVQPGTNWDPFRKGLDSTGFVSKLLGKVSSPNNYELGDGLNTAGLRWIRHERGGNENLFGFADTGLFGGIDRKQANIKIDHNFNASNKLAVTYTYERDDGLANLMTLPDTFTGSTYRRPHQLAVNYVSTLSPSTVNEFRAGLRRTSGNTFNALYDPQYSAAAKAYYPNASGIPVWIGLGQSGGQVNFQGTQPLGSGTTSSYQDITKLWSYGDTLSWTKSKHSFKVGAEMRRQNSWAKDTGVGTTAVPRALGGDAPLAAISTTAISATNMPGLGGTAMTGNNARMRQLLSFLSGSLSSITQAYYMQSPTKLDAFEDYRTYPSRIRDYHENEFSLFFKDDWKATNNLTLNLGLRYDWYGSPYEASGLMPLPVGGGYSIFGISGRGFSDWMKPGARAESTTLQFVGKNSPNSGIPWYPNNWKNFGPAVGFAYQAPWLGAGKTTVRGGYQITYQIGESFNNLFQEQNVPGSIYNATYTGDSNITYLDLTKLNSAIPLPVPTKPMQAIPVTDRSQSLYVPDPALATPYAQNLTLAVTRSITSKVTLDLRYVGTLARKQRSASNNINIPNFLYNGLKEAFDAARTGGESTVLNQMLNGINLGAGTVGQNGFTGAAAIRADSRFNTNMANGNYQALAASLNTLNYSTALNPSLPTFPANVQGAVMRVNNFPENFIVTNPQFSTINWISDNASNNYHSFNAQVTVRPTNGITWQSTYIWSKNLGINGLIGGGLGTTFTNPADRHKDYALLSDTRVHDFRTNGTLALPVGPGKLLFGNSKGVAARLIEGWQTSWIVNLNTGQPLNIVAQSMLYANGTPDIVGPFDVRSAHVKFTGGPTGSYFAAGSLKQVTDPQCGTLPTSLRNLCSLSAIQDVKTGQIVLQNPLPGTRGTLGQRVLEGPGRWRFDASLAKSVKLTETKNLQFRMDAQNVLNHPEPQLAVTGTSLINLDINAANFGLITGPQAKANTNRQFQAQLRLNF